MKEHIPPEKKSNYEIVTYHKAGHLIEPPYSPLTRMSYHKAWGKIRHKRMQIPKINAHTMDFNTSELYTCICHGLKASFGCCYI